MIDQKLINDNSVYLSNALKNSVTISPQIKFLTNVFDQPVLVKLQEYFANQYHSNLWQFETTEYGEIMSNVPRYKISWDPESVVEEIHEVCNSVTPVVEEMCQGKTAFHGIALWRDHSGYNIGWHTDNPILKITMQIYLDGLESCPGTEFKTDSGTIVAPFVKNTGYFLNQGELRPMHRLAHTVPHNQTRYSLFAMWKNIS